jgi:cytochrome P450 PksS
MIGGSGIVDIAAAAFKADPWPVLARLRSEAAVSRVRAGTRPAWLITRYAEAVAALKDPALVKDKSAISGRTPMPRWMPAFAQALGRNMLDLDDPDHRRLRALVQPAFTPRLIERLRERVRTLSGELLDRMPERGTIDVIDEYAAPIPTTIIAEMLGIPPADRFRFRRWTEHIVVADTSDWAMLRAMPSILAFVRYLRRLIEDKRRNPADDVISALLAAEAEGDRLSADEVMAMAFLLIVAGHETTVNLIGNGILALIEHPDALLRIREDPAFVVPALEEILRFSGPLMISTERYARENLDLGGAKVRKGDLVYVSLAGANRDPAAFARPDRFDIGRAPNRHIAFGDGLHFCLGSALARMEGRVAIDAFVSRFGRLGLAEDRSRLAWKGGATLRGLHALKVSAR